MDGFEADDLIGTLARKASEAGMETTIVTGDAVEIKADGVRERFGDRKRREVKRAAKINVPGYGGGV